MNKTTSLRIRALVVVVVLLLLLLPIYLYVSTFGMSLSTSHTRWSEMGNFMAGIFAPIAAFLTLVLLAGQLTSQVEFNKHQIDQNFINSARADLHFYLHQLDNILLKHEQISNVPLNHTLVVMFGLKAHEELREGLFAKDVARIGMTDKRISALWAAIYTIFSGLKAVNEIEYESVYEASKLKCISMYGYALCNALDNFHYVATEYPDSFAYEFISDPCK